MALYDGRKLAQDGLLDVATHCTQAALHAPQLTGKTDIKIEVLEGDELDHYFGVEAELAQLGIVTTAEAMKVSKDFGEPPVVMLIGIDGSVSQTAWDCGACGFDTCRDFNKYTRKNLGWGYFCKGPNCVWKVIDFGMAVDWAAGAAHNYHVDSRVQEVSGGLFLRMGYLEGCTMCIAVPLGPCKEHWYYAPGAAPAPPIWMRDMMLDYQSSQYPPLFLQFLGPGKDFGRVPVKASEKFWERPKKFAKVEEDQEFEGFVAHRYARLFELTNEVRRKRGLEVIELTDAEKDI